MFSNSFRLWPQRAQESCVGQQSDFRTGGGRRVVTV